MADPAWRVSVATLCRVLLDHPPGRLALERKATAGSNPAGQPGVLTQPGVLAQPFGGAVRILDPRAVEAVTGPLRYDSPHSRAEQDFRILIDPGLWPAVRAFCLRALQDEGGPLETSPQRELSEEFAGALGEISPGTISSGKQYTVRRTGLLVEDRPSASYNIHAPGAPTVRVYAVYEVAVTSAELCQALLRSSASCTDAQLQARAQADRAAGGAGRANAALVLPLAQVEEAFRDRQGSAPVRVGGHRLHSSVGAVLPKTP